MGRYEVLARLASGGMAGVYVARALGVAGFERLFAIKVLHPHLAHEEEFISMFLDEARLAARIRHQNVVPTIDISDTEDAGFFLVMDYIEGDHLGALLQQAYRRGSRLPAPVALRIVVDALNGLGAAHALTDENGQRINLVHRDVSPHNVMVSTDGIARLTDFGVAKAEVRISTTQDGQFKGKLAYMAPEHASNGESDQRSDLFSMAIILWECLTGRRLFRAENHAATLHRICLEPIPAPSSVDPELAPFDAVLARGLERDPARRFQTAEEFAEAIEEHAVALGGLANPRTVGKLVRELAEEKLERDQGLVRAAMSEISVATGTDSNAAPVFVAPARSKAATAGAPPITAPPPATATGAASERVASADGLLDDAVARPRSKLPLIVLGLALLAVALAATATWLNRAAPVQSESLAPAELPAESPAESARNAPEPTDPSPAGSEARAAEQASGAPPIVAPSGELEAQGTPSPRERANVPAEQPAAEPEQDADRPKNRPRPRRAPKASEDDLLLNPYRTTN